MSREPRRIESRDNALVQRVRKLQQDPGAYRKLGQCWLEGEHLGSALWARGRRAATAMFSDSAWRTPAQGLATLADDVVVLPDRLFESLSQLPSSAGMGWLCEVPAAPPLLPEAATLILDRLQDAGNVGSILRSASALGVRQVIALRGTAGLWSPKVLRAGMGAQWALTLFEGKDLSFLDGLHMPFIATSSHASVDLHRAELPRHGAWVLGHEGQGVDPALMARCSLVVRIPQPGGEESLNVAAAAAICLYESLRRVSD